MKKFIGLMLSMLICASNIECKPKKINRFNEFLKGTIALGAAASLAYLAYEAPVGKIQTQWTKLKNKVMPTDSANQLNDWLSNNTERLFNFVGTSTPWNKINKTKLFSLITIIPAYEFTKYALDKLGNSVRTNNKENTCKQKD